MEQQNTVKGAQSVHKKEYTSSTTKLHENKRSTCHGENPDENIDVAATDNGNFTLAASTRLLHFLGFSRCPDPNYQDDNIKNHYGHQSRDIHRHGSLVTQCTVHQLH